MPLLTFMRGYIGCMTKLNFDVGYFLDITNAESFSLCITINLHQTLHVHASFGCISFLTTSFYDLTYSSFSMWIVIRLGSLYTHNYYYGSVHGLIAQPSHHPDRQLTDSLIKCNIARDSLYDSGVL